MSIKCSLERLRRNVNVIRPFVGTGWCLFQRQPLFGFDPSRHRPEQSYALKMSRRKAFLSEKHWCWPRFFGTSLLKRPIKYLFYKTNAEDINRISVWVSTEPHEMQLTNPKLNKLMFGICNLYKGCNINRGSVNLHGIRRMNTKFGS